MKKILLGFLSLAMLATMVSCEEDTTAGISKISYFPEIVISSGAQTDVVLPGSDYPEPTAVATSEGETLEVITTITSQNGASAFDINVADIYTFTFTSYNVDGYPAVASKLVIVSPMGDMVNSIEGVYTMDVTRLDPFRSFSGQKYGIISKISGDLYEVSNAAGGFYSIGYNYGPDYAFAGMQIQANDIAANDFSFPSSGITVGWAGDGPVEVTAAVVDPVAKTISWQATWTAVGYVWDVTYRQVQP